MKRKRNRIRKWVVKRKMLHADIGGKMWSNDLTELILLLDGVGVGGALGGVDELISEALSNGLDVAESRLTGLGGVEDGDGMRC